MNAAEIIELIKTLPPEERKAVLAYVRASSEQDPSSEVRYIPDDTFKDIAPRVFTTHRELMRKLAQ